MHPRDDQLVGYLLNALDEAARLQVESQLRRSAALRHQLETLRAALEPLEADRADPLPPTGLADRTLARIDNCARSPRAPRTSRREFGSPSRWRRSELLVASLAGVIVLGFALAWVDKSRALERVTVCANNLRDLHTPSVQYAMLQSDGAFPRIEAEGPRSFAGAVIPVLVEAGTLSPDNVPTCSTHPGWKLPPELAQPGALEKCYREDRDRYNRVVASMAGCYSYSLGYRTETGLCGLRHGAGMDGQPIAADAPPFQGRGVGSAGNSTAHGRRGQNILFVDGSVRFVTVRTIAGDDVYLNQERFIHAGVHRGDSVLGASDASP